MNRKPNNPKKSLKKRLLDGYDIRELFKISARTVINWCQKGMLIPSKVGGKNFYDADDLHRLLDERKQVQRPTIAEKKKKDK